MSLSVVVPTLNGREQLATCLDALAAAAPDAEIVVVNGPSADGTTGMLRERDDVDRIVQIADRRLTVAWNAGIDHATGDVVALLDRSLTIEPEWLDGLEAGIDSAAVVTGPTRHQLRGGTTTETAETLTIKGRTVSRLNPGNLAIRRAVVDELDGFDEYLDYGGTEDLAHRVAGAGYAVAWEPTMAATREYEADGGVTETRWHWEYRARAYSLAKNYGLRPTVIARLLASSVGDAASSLRSVLAGTATPSKWLGNGRDVVTGIATGLKDGYRARRRDDAPRRNPNGRSMRTDRVIDVYD